MSSKFIWTRLLFLLVSKTLHERWLSCHHISPVKSQILSVVVVRECMLARSAGVKDAAFWDPTPHIQVSALQLTS